MIASLLIGKHNSGGVPGKNYRNILGRPMVEYPLLAAHHAPTISKIFVSTDSPDIAKSAQKFDAELIQRPEKLAQSDSPTEDAFAHGYQAILKAGLSPEFLVLLFANTPCIHSQYLEKGIELLRKNPDWDSVISLAKFNMFAPMRARSRMPDGTCEPTIDLASLNLSNTFHRDAQGDIYFCDFSVQIVRPERCLVDVAKGVLPFLWLGKKHGYVEIPGGFDVDAEWQIAAAEHWLQDLGFSENTMPYDSLQ